MGPLRFGYTKPTGRSPVKICFTCSTGGHLSQLEQLRPWFERHQRYWIVLERDDTRAILPDERMLSPYYPTTRNPWNAARNFLLACRALRSNRPDVVVSTGAGVAVPVFLAARLLRIPTVYIEVFGRIDLATWSGKMCYPMANLFLLQWPDQKAFYPKGEFVGALFPAISTSTTDRAV